MVVDVSKLLLIKNQRPDSMLKVGRRWENMSCDKRALLFFVKFYVQVGAGVGRWCIKIDFSKKVKTCQCAGSWPAVS